MTSKPLIDGIQVLRGIAALLVVIRHGTKETSTINFEVGQFGVDIFFVISGFVIFLTSQSIDWRLFAKKRFFRIAPLYWSVTLVTLIAAILLNKGDTISLLVHAVYSVFFIPHGNFFPTLYVGWTLNYEMWFYLLFGCLIFARVNLLKYCSVAIITLVSIGLLYQHFNEWKLTAFTIPLLPITLEFLAGVWLAHIYTKGINVHPITCGILFVIAIVWLYLAPTAGAYVVWRPVAWGVPGVLIVLGVLGLERHIRFKRFTAAMLIGNASYAIYLIHPLVIRAAILLIEKLAVNISEYVLVATLVVLSMLVGTALHILVERRMTAYFNKF